MVSMCPTWTCAHSSKSGVVILPCTAWWGTTSFPFVEPAPVRSPSHRGSCLTGGLDGAGFPFVFWEGSHPLYSCLLEEWGEEEHGDCIQSLGQARLWGWGVEGRRRRFHLHSCQGLCGEPSLGSLQQGWQLPGDLPSLSSCWSCFCGRSFSQLSWGFWLLARRTGFGTGTVRGEDTGYGWPQGFHLPRGRYLACVFPSGQKPGSVFPSHSRVTRAMRPGATALLGVHLWEGGFDDCPVTVAPPQAGSPVPWSLWGGCGCGCAPQGHATLAESAPACCVPTAPSGWPGPWRGLCPAPSHLGRADLRASRQGSW